MMKSLDKEATRTKKDKISLKEISLSEISLGFVCLGFAIIVVVAVHPLAAFFASDDRYQAVEDAINHPDRPDHDKVRDEHRHPQEVLSLLALAPESTVLELFAGDGYYTELLSRIVGDQGRILHHNSKAFAGSLTVAIRQRFKDKRLPNVDRVTTELHTLDLQPATFDAALLSLTYHDYYFQSPAWPGVDEKAFLAKLFSAMKSGARVAVIDHAAAKGTGSADAARLHRIEKTVVLEDFKKAGFLLEAESDRLANPQDDHSLSVFDPRIRGMTDRFIVIFKKP